MCHCCAIQCYKLLILYYTSTINLITKSPERVLVGKDQNQHVELTRKISKRLNLDPFETINTYQSHAFIFIAVISKVYLILIQR